MPKGWIPANDTAEKRGEAAVKLRKHFKRIGFKRIGRTKYYGVSPEDIKWDGAKAKPRSQRLGEPEE